MFDLVVVENVSEILALLIVSGFGVLLLKPVKGVLSALTFKIREADNLEIFGIKLDRTELREIIVQREILRTAIYIATVDEDFSLKEMQFLNDRANAMGGSLENLTPDAKQRILDEAVAIAAADEVIREDEYVALKRKAQELKFSVDQIDEMIVQKCLTREVVPPKKLESRVAELRQKRGL